MPSTLEQRQATSAPRPAPAALATGARPGAAARRDLQRQIGRLERRLGELFGEAFPRRGIEWGAGAAGGPRLLGTGELERVRDALAQRVREAEDELDRHHAAERANRELVERMTIAPERYRWVRVSNRDQGRPGCRHWHSRPRWGPLGILLGWWRVRISSGCPLAVGRRPGPGGP